MSDPRDASYFVIPLSVQKEDDFYLVGNVDLQEFYQFPETGLYILNTLREGGTPASIKASLAYESEETVDVDDFIDTLLEIGFIYRADEKNRHDTKQPSATQHKHFFFVASRKLANILYTPGMLVCYLSFVGYALYSMIQTPALRPNLHAFYFANNLTLNMVVLLALTLTIALAHELGHVLAAARHGIRSKLSLGNRLWVIVLESDLTGILSLPKRQRYLPMLGGMLVDLLTIALLTLLTKLLIDHGSEGRALQIVQALIMQTILTLAWQLNIFLKTDIYYVLCNYLGHPDLDRDARIYLRNLQRRFKFWRISTPEVPLSRGNTRILRLFVVIWVAGRAVALTLLCTVALPTIYRYMAQAYRLYRSPKPNYSSVCDLSLFTLILLSIMGSGMYRWINQRRQS